MSPEMDLLDQLSGSDESLHLALQVFGWPTEEGALGHARRALLEQIREGLVCIKHKGPGGERILPEDEVRLVLAESGNWLKRGEAAEYYLGLTEKGVAYIG